MMMENVIADVRVSEEWDRLVITPRHAAEIHALSRVLRDALPGVPLRRSAEGISLNVQNADAALRLVGVIDLRWTPEAERFTRNRQKAKRLQASFHSQVSRIRLGSMSVANSLIADVSGLDVLDDHQRVNVAAMTLTDGYGLCVFDEQGAGKTVSGIYAFDVLAARGEIDFMLIVSPKSMVAEWPRDIRRFKGDLYRVEVIAGLRQVKKAAISSGADILVTNFETTTSMEDELCSRLRRYNGRVVLIVDESFYIKNLNTSRTRSLRRLREFCNRAFVLCGTPAPNAPHDLIQQFNIVDFGFTFAGIDIPKDREEARPVVQEAIERRGLYTRHLKADVLPGLPGKTFNRVLVPLQPDQYRIYRAALENFILDLRATDNDGFRREITSFLARRSALLQICSNPASIVDGYSEVPAKLQALDELLEEVIHLRHEKVVLWSFYTASISAIVARYSRYYPVRYDGTVSDIDVRRERVRRFQEDDETMLFVANPAAAGAGITLHRARYAIYESMSNQAAHYLQSLDRIHRRGQTRSVEYLVLLCDRTIELEEYNRLIAKERSAQNLLGDIVAEPTTRETMLAEATTARELLGSAI